MSDTNNLEKKDDSVKTNESVEKKHDIEKKEDHVHNDNAKHKGEHKKHESMHHATKKHKPVYHTKKNETVRISKTAVWQTLTVLFFIAAVVFFALWLDSMRAVPVDVGNEDSNEDSFMNKLSEDEFTTKTIDTFKTKLLPNGAEPEISNLKYVNGVYTFELATGGQQFIVYASSDGELIFPQAIVVSETPDIAQQGTEQAAPPTPEVKKAEEPVVELFVMSHCPYGTQIEKGILPVAELLGDKMDLQVKFVYYSMHGKTEVDEQLLQYCIDKEQPDKYLAYLQCFLEKGETDTCLDKVSITKDSLKTCMDAADEEFSVTENLNDKASYLSGNYPLFDIYKADNEKYGVGGSPTLVINGEQVSSGRDPQSLKNAICAGFNNPPQECNTPLSTASPSTGFGYGTSASDVAAAGCEV